MPLTFRDAVLSIAVALAAGALIGSERQQSQVGRRVGDFGGVRTFPLLAVLGAVGALLHPVLGPWFVITLLGAVVVVLGISQARTRGDDLGVSSEVAAIVTFALGALAGSVELMANELRYLLVLGVAATTMALLALKRPLHGFIAKVSNDDVYATVKFVLLSLVVIPLLPDRAYGPLDVLNPRKIGLMTALVAGVSFAGYVVARIVGSRRGLLLTGIVGGLVSSTALTLALSSRAKKEPALAPLCTLGIVAACSTMFARILFIVAILHWPLLETLALPVGSMAAAGYAYVAVAYRSGRDTGSIEEVSYRNPFELSEAVKFGLLYGLILFVAKAAEQYVGPRGIYASAFLAGLTDVDATTISLTELHRSGTNATVAAPGILIAAFTNTFIKAGIATFVGGRPLGSRVLRVLAGVLLAGLLALTARTLLYS